MKRMIAELPDSGLRRFPVVLLLFVGSGCAALIYEVVWFQLLEMVIGSTAISMGVLLATFMGGMCIGSLALPRIVPQHFHPLRVYALLELGIGILGVFVFWGLPQAARLYLAMGGSGTAGLFLRGLIAAVCLLPPTLLMGATLPAIARWVKTTPAGVSWLGFFYGANIAGAVLGSLFTGFWLLRVYDVAIATCVAVAVNILVALAAIWLAGITAKAQRIDQSSGAPGHDGVAPVFLAIALSGMTALAAEVVWTRLLSLILGATVYTFSLILAAFLLGLGIGSGSGAFLARSVANARSALGWCQLLLMGAIAWAGYVTAHVIPYWSINLGTASPEWTKFLFDFARCLVAVLPAATLWGASFPLALAGAVPGARDAGLLVGSVYAANTLGAIIGALGASLGMIGSVGSQGTQRIMVAVAGAAAVLMLAPESADAPRLLVRRLGSISRVGLTLTVAGVLAWTASPIPGRLVAFGHYISRFVDLPAEFVYVGEGMNSSLAVSRLPNGILMYHNAGKVQASSELRDMGLQRMLGHLTTLVPENPRSVLVIGCGAGVTAGAASIDPAVERLTVVEIERLVPEIAAAYFGEYNFNVLQNPKVRVVIDDARHYVLTTREKFDAITSDPLDPWVKGAATLYTREFFELLKKHLNPGGVVTVFVQLYLSSTAAVKSEFATFFEAFPNGSVWLNRDEFGGGYDVVLLGQVEPARVDLDVLEQRLSSPAYTPVALSLGDVCFLSAEDLLSTFGAMGKDLGPWLADAEINRDRNLRLQYLAGLGLDLSQQDEIYGEIVKLRRFPTEAITGSQDKVSSLRARLESTR